MKNLVTKIILNISTAIILLGLTSLYMPLAAQADAVFDPHPEACIAPGLKLPAWTNVRGWNDDAHQMTIALANVTADRDLELVGRDPQGVAVYELEIDPDRGWWAAWMPRFSAEKRKPDLANPAWSRPDRYSTIRYLDLNGDGIDEMVAHENAGRGLLAFSFKGGDSESTGNWELLNKAGFKLPASTNWASDRIYSGFRVGKVLEGATEQLVVRSESGIIGIVWDPLKANFSLLSDPAKKDLFSNWHDRRYYSTIHLADINGDGLDEVVGRSAAGLMAAEYIPGTGWKVTVSPNEILNDQEAGFIKFFETLTWGNFLDEDKESVAIWTNKGVQLVQLNDSKGSWERVTPTTSKLLPDSHFEAGLFRAADIDGDGLDELNLVYPQGGGLGSYRFRKNAWQKVNTGNTKNENLMTPEYTTAHYGDIDGDGLAEVVSRNPLGLVTYFYNLDEKRWDENFSCGFPEFTGREASAYAALNHLLFTGSTEVRHQYNDSSQNTNHYRFIDHQKIKPDDNSTSYDQRDWESMSSQLLRELTWANSTLAVFSAQQKIFVDQYTSEWETMDTVGTDLLHELDSVYTINLEAIFESLIEGAIDIATEGLTKVLFKDNILAKTILGGLSQLMGAGVEPLVGAASGALFPSESTTGTVAFLKNELVTKKEGLKAQLGILAADITGLELEEGDLGTMAAVAKLHNDGYWPTNFSGATFIADKARWNFKRWMYQQIIPAVYRVNIYDCNPGYNCYGGNESTRHRTCYDVSSRPVKKKPAQWCLDAAKRGGPSRPAKWVYIGLEKKGLNGNPLLPKSVLTAISGKLSESCQQVGQYKVDSCNMGLPPGDLLAQKNGWNFYISNHSHYVDNNGVPKGSLGSCGGLDATIIGDRNGGVIYGTPEADVIMAFDGNDVIYSGGGDDVICSGGGDDLVYGGPGDDTIILGYGADYAAGGDGDDKLYGEAGKDWLVGGMGDDELAGGRGNDKLNGGAGFDVIYGGPDNISNDCSGEETYYCAPDVSMGK